MKMSSRAKRMNRRHSRMKAVATLNLTSLMDIFTIILIFLLVNNNNAAKPPENRDIVLPSSTAETVPEEVLTIQLSGKNLLVQDVPVVSVEQIMAAESKVIDALKEELDFRASRSLPKLNEAGEPEREVMLQADRKVPYALISRVMRTCMETEYTKISFAVLRKTEDEGQ